MSDLARRMLTGIVLADASAAAASELLTRRTDQVDLFEAIARLFARWLNVDLARTRTSFEVTQMIGSEWKVVATLAVLGNSVAIVPGSGGASDPDVLRLALMSDVGVLELAGFSLSRPRPPGWLEIEPVTSEVRIRFIRDADRDTCHRARLEGIASSPSLASERMAARLARAIEIRIEATLEALRESGGEFGPDDLARAVGAFFDHVSPPVSVP